MSFSGDIALPGDIKQDISNRSGHSRISRSKGAITAGYPRSENVAGSRWNEEYNSDISGGLTAFY